MDRADDEGLLSRDSSREPVYRFGSYRFDPSSGDLHGPEAGTQRLQNQPATLLRYMLDHAGDVVPRERIQTLLWSDTKVEYDQGINFCVRKIREALDETADDEGYIETLPGRGYRFTGDVAREEPESSNEEDGGRRPLILAIGASMGIAALTAFVVWFGGSDRPSPAASKPLVAVLPHRPADDASSLDEVGSRIAETLVVELTRRGARSIRVAGPAATTALLDEARPTAVARSNLGACLTVSGTIDRTGDGQVVVFTQLIRTGDNAHLWAERDTVDEAGVSARASELAVSMLGVVQDDTTRAPAPSSTCPERSDPL